MLIKFISWNVNGIRALAKKEQWTWLWESGAQIIGLQETKASLEQLPPEVASPGKWTSYWDSSTVKKGYSGVAAFTEIEPVNVNRQLPDPEYQGEGRMIHLEFAKFHFITCYIPNGGAPELDEDGIFTGSFKRVNYKMGFLASLMQYSLGCLASKPVVMCGDFNIAVEGIDLAKPKDNEGFTGFLPVERDWMKNFLAAGFIDTFRHIHGNIPGKYTWWSYQNMARRRNNGWRIDYFLASRNLEAKIQDAVIYSEVLGSDHCPIGLSIDF